MIVGGILLLVAQAGSAPPPVVVVDNVEEQPVGAISWTCTAMLGRQTGNLSLAGQFPAISVEAQKNGQALRLQATMRSTQDQRFNGTFPSALTSSSAVAGISSYSILIPGTQPGRPKFILTFQDFLRANDGFVNILEIDPSSGAPSAYAAGTCKLEVSQ